MAQKKSAKSPCEAELVAGVAYEWCSCGKTNTSSFCDGSHEGTGCTPISFVAHKTEAALLCGCCESSDAPYCDGTHNII